MRHRKAGRKLRRSSSHRKALFRNLTTELLRHERIKTTEAKARAIRSRTEKLITLAKRGLEDESYRLHARRQVEAQLTDGEVARKLCTELAERYFTRPGGYTRLYKLGPRKGDAALMAIVELVEE